MNPSTNPLPIAPNYIVYSIFYFNEVIAIIISFFVTVERHQNARSFNNI